MRDKRGGGYHDFLSKLFCLIVHSTEKLRRGTLLCFTKFLVPKKFMDKRGGGGGKKYQNFLSKMFLSHSAEKIRRGTLLCCVSENFRWRKSLSIRRGEYQDFPSKFFCLTVPKNAVGEPFSLSLFSGIEKVLMRGWGGAVSRFSVENFLSHSAEKFRRGTL